MHEWRPGGRGFDLRRSLHHSFVEIMKYFSTIILPLPLIQEGQLSVSGERMHNTDEPLRGLNLPSKRVVR